MISVTEPIVCTSGKYAYWQCSWYEDGRRRWKNLGPATGKKAISKAEAKRRAKEHELAENTTPSAGKGGATSLEHWLKLYASESEGGDATQENLAITAALLLAHFKPKTRLDKITPRMATEFRHALTDPYAFGLEKKQGRGRPRGEQTIRKHMRYCKAIFQKAVDDELIRKNPFEKQKSAVLAVDKDWAEIGGAEMDRILDACPGQSWKNLFALCRWGCLRQSEATALLWKQVDTVNFRTFTVLNVGKQTTKKRTRVVPITPRLEVALREAWEAAREGSSRVCEFSSHDAHRLETLAHDVIQRAQVADYEKPFHTLRKLGVTDLCGIFTPAEVSEASGHSIQVLMKHYYRSNAANMAERMRTFGGETVVKTPETTNGPDLSEPQVAV